MSPEEMAKAMINNIKPKTGKSLEEWKVIVKASGLEKHGQIIKHLKSEHGITHGFANLIAHESKQSSAYNAEDADLIQGQYSGLKAELKPIYDKILAAVEQFGSDVQLAPKKAYVSLRRNKQFALVQPSTKTRIDVGIKLKGVEAAGKLEESGKWNQMVTHRVRVSDISEVTDELIGWLKEAYENA